MIDYVDAYYSFSIKVDPKNGSNKKISFTILAAELRKDESEH